MIQNSSKIQIKRDNKIEYYHKSVDNDRYYISIVLHSDDSITYEFIGRISS